MARREYLDEHRMYSNILEDDGSAPKKSVQYYKKVEKTTKTVSNNGENPRTKVVSTTIIKENDNPEQITRKVYTTGHFGEEGYDEDNQNLEDNHNFQSFGDYDNSNGYEVYSRRFESTTKNDGYSGMKSSYLNSNDYQSNTYKNSGQVETTRNIITSSNTVNKTYTSNIGGTSFNNQKDTGYISNIGNKYSNIGSGYSKSSYLKTTETENKVSSILDNEDNSNSYLAKARALLGKTDDNTNDNENRTTSYLNIQTTETENKVSSILNNEDNSNSYLAKARALLGKTDDNTNDNENKTTSYLNIQTTETENRVKSILDNDDNSNTYLAKANALLGRTDNNTNDNENKTTSYLNIQTTEAEDRIKSILGNDYNTNKYLSKINTNEDNENNNNYTSGRVSKYSSYSYNTGSSYLNNLRNEDKGKTSSLFNKYGPGVKETRSESYGNKEKYTFAGTVKEKDNYLYYVSGVGYVNKEGEPIKKERAVSQPKPIIKDEREEIKIETKRIEEQGELVDNYNYKESKYTKNKDKDSIVIHRRLGDPFYQNIVTERKRFSSYTPRPRRFGATTSTTTKEYGVNTFSNIGKTTVIETESEKRNKYSNKTENIRSLIDTSKYLNTNTNEDVSSIVNKYLNISKNENETINSAKDSISNYNTYKNNEDYGNNNYNTSYQRTVNIEESTRNYVPKSRYDIHTENGRGNRSSRWTVEKTTETKTINDRGTSNIISSSSQGRRHIVPLTNKTYEEKTEESYKKERNLYGSNSGEKDLDTDKYKSGISSVNKYQSKTEEKYQTEITNENYEREGYSQSRFQPKNEKIYIKETTEDNYQKEEGLSTDNQPQITDTYQQSSLVGQNYGQNYLNQYQQQTQDTYQVNALEQNYEKEGTSTVQYGADTNAISQNYQKEGTSNVQYGVDTNAISQNYEKEGTSNVQYGVDTNAISQNYEKEGTSTVQYGADTNAIAQNYEKEGTSTVQYGVDANAISQNYQKEGTSNVQYGVDTNAISQNYEKEGTSTVQYGVDANAISQNYQKEGTSNVQYGVDTNAISQNYQKEGTSNVQYGVDTNAITQNYEKEGTSNVQYGVDINAISQNYQKEGASNVQYVVDKRANKQNYQRGGYDSNQYGQEGQYAQEMQYGQEGQEGVDQNQYGQEGQEGQEGIVQNQYGQEGQEGQEGVDQNQYGQYEPYDQYDQYDQYNQYEQYGQYGEYDQYGKYGQDQEDMEQMYPMGRYPRNKYKKIGRRYQQKKIKYSQPINVGRPQRMNLDSHICPVHGLKGKQGKKYGQNTEYLETRKEIKRFEGMEGGKGRERQYGKNTVRSMGGRREENKYQFINEQINNVQKENEEELDNYKFYESKNVTTKIEKKTSVNVQNIVNTSESNVNTLNVKNIRGNTSITGSGVGMGQGMQSMGMQSSRGMQQSQGSEYSKIYIATKVTPVYSELVNQQQHLNLSGRNVCSVCGGDFIGLGQMNSNTQGILYGCPIHGYSMVQEK